MKLLKPVKNDGHQVILLSEDKKTAFFVDANGFVMYRYGAGVDFSTPRDSEEWFVDGNRINLDSVEIGDVEEFFEHARQVRDVYLWLRQMAECRKELVAAKATFQETSATTDDPTNHW